GWNGTVITLGVMPGAGRGAASWGFSPPPPPPPVFWLKTPPPAMAEQKGQATATLDPSAPCAPEWTEILRQMIFIRRFEEATEREFRRGKIGGYLHRHRGRGGVARRVMRRLLQVSIVFSW